MIIALQAALAADCIETSIGELAKTDGPGVFVLGERRGTQPDLARATKLVHKLRNAGHPVTIALSAIPYDRQEILDRYKKGELDDDDLPDLLDWGAVNGFPWEPYARLAMGSRGGSDVLAVGVDFESRPTNVPLTVPPGYMSVLQDGMSSHFMPVDAESAFMQNVAWMDLRIARAALENWDGKGFVVIIADIAHVEGGKGIAYQASQLTEAPVHTVNLGGPGHCYRGDKHL